VTIFLEKFILPLLVALVAAVILNVSLKLDTFQRVALCGALLFAALFVGHTLENRAARKNSLPVSASGSTGQSPEKPEAVPPQTTSSPVAGQSAPHKVKPKAARAPAPSIVQHSEGPNSPNIVGDNNQVVVKEERLSRRLSAAQKDALVNALSGFPKPNVKLLVWPGGPEVENFKADFVDVFGRLDWPIISTDVSIMPARDSGLAVVVSNPEEYAPAAGALLVEVQKMGFKIVGTSDKTLQKDEIRFVVAPAE